MLKKNLENIYEEWREPVQLGCLMKEANGWTDFLKKLLDIPTALGKAAIETAKNSAGALAVSIPVTAALSAAAYQKITSPKALADSADKQLLKNSLETEIAYYKRKIAEEELRRSTDVIKDKQYDRFVG